MRSVTYSIYETMLYWESANQQRTLDDAELVWAAIWKPLPKVVFSTTLSVVQSPGSCSSHDDGPAVRDARGGPVLLLVVGENPDGLCGDSEAAAASLPDARIAVVAGVGSGARR